MGTPPSIPSDGSAVPESDGDADGNATAAATGTAWSERLRSIAATFERLGHELAGAQAATVMEAVTQVAVQRVGGTRWASITLYQNKLLTTAAASDDRARRADAIQYEVGSGPCLDAAVDDTVYAPSDLPADTRWPEYGKRVFDELGVASMLSYRLALDTDNMIGSLNLYSDRPSAFDEEALALGMLLATHGALAVIAASNRERADQLQRALETSRDIGVAIGILMHQHKLSRSQAFDLLRIASQNSNRKVHEIAVDVADTGILTLPRRTDPVRPKAAQRPGPRAGDHRPVDSA
jgi:hypothetical protein